MRLTTARGKKAILLYGILGVLSSACVSGPHDPVNQLLSESLSKQAYERALPNLEQLAPGDDVGSFLSQDMRIFRVERGTRDERLVLIIPGWISEMSGHVASFPFGMFFARSGTVVRGRHVFGYVWGEMNLTPQFQVITEATLIDKSEYDRLKSQDAERIGSFPGESGWRYFRDLRVLESGPLPFPGAPVGWGGDDLEEESSTSTGYRLEPADFSDFHSEAAFRKTEARLRTLSAGMEIWAALAELDAFFITNDYGLGYAIAVPGFFGHQTRSFDTDAAVYRLRPFGYREGDREVIKLIAVFKNDQLQQVVSHTGRTDWSKYITR